MSDTKRKNDKRRNAANTIIIASAAYIVMGIIMVIFPQATKDLLCFALGAALTIYGVFNIISFLRDREKSMYFELIVGVLTTAFGIFSLISPATIADMIMTVIGVLIVVDSLLDAKHSIDLKKLGMKYWWIYMIISTAVIILGLCTVFFADFFGSALIILLGIILIYEGISSLAVAFMISRYTKKANTVIIEASATDNY